MFDAHANLASAPIAVAPSPALSGTSLIITAGYAALFPAVPFNCTIFPAGVNPTQANAEIVRVTNIVGDIFTIVRAQEGTTAKAIATGWTIANTVSAKVLTDIETQAVLSISAGTTNATGNQIVFSNSNGVSFGASNNIITASFSGGGGGGGAAISAGANSQSTGTVVFSASNGVTFGLSNDGVMTASHNGITAQTAQPVAASASNGSFAFSTLAFSNANNVTFGTSAGGIITASVATAAGGGSVNFSAGTQSANLASIVFSNSNGVSFGLSNGTVTASAAGGTAGAAFTASIFEPIQLANNTSNVDWDGNQNRIAFDPINLPFHLAFTQVKQIISASVSFNGASVSTLLTGSCMFSHFFGIYTRSVTDSAATNFSNSSVIVTHLTNLWTMQVFTSGSSSSKTVEYYWQSDSTGGSASSSQSTNSSNMAVLGMSQRMFLGYPFSATLPPGEYWLGRMFASASSNLAQRAWLSSVYELTWNGATSAGRSSLGDTGNGNNNGNNFVLPGLGHFTTSSASLPDSVNLISDLRNSNIAGLGRRYYVFQA